MQAAEVLIINSQSPDMAGQGRSFIIDVMMYVQLL